MATGPEHYREAERRLRMAWEEGRDPQSVAHLLAEAQVHATLALAAATAMSAPVDGEADSGMPRADVREWMRVAGVNPPKGGAV